jgi:hypothetical protein
VRHIHSGLLDAGYNRSYTSIMKTAISIPDDVFESAERMARRMGISRSELYVRAVRTYLDRHRDEAITERLDRVYAQADSRLDPVLQAAQQVFVSDEEW